MGDAEINSEAFRRSELCLATPYLKPQSETETLLARIWQQALNVDIIGTQDDFFEIGGDSLAATILASELEKCFGCKFSPSNIIENSTIADQSAYLDRQQENDTKCLGTLPSYLTLFNREGTKAPLFIVHGNRGFIIYHKGFLDGFDPDQPIGFIEAPGLDGKEPPLGRIEEYAQRYLDLIRQVAPEGNWLLASNCTGSLIAFEMCLLAEKHGDRVSRLIMVDPISGHRLALKRGGRLSLMKVIHPANWPWVITEIRRRVMEKKWRRRKYQDIKSRARGLFRVLPTRMFRRRDSEEVAYAAAVAEFDHRYKKYEKRIHHRTASNGADFVPSRMAYNPEAMMNVCHALDKAYWDYIVRQGWSGRSFILTSPVRVNGLDVWKRYLPNALCRVVKYDHESLFKEGLPDVVNFLNDAIAPNPEEHF